MLLGTTVLLESNTAVIMLMSVFYVPLRQLPSSKFIVISKMNSTQHWPIESLNKWLN